jgi:hypothetical protein
VAALLILLFLPGVRLCHGQATATIEGYVLDPSGAAIPNATVSVKNLQTGIARTVQSDGAGRFSVSSLDNATYEVDAEADGFSRKVVTGVILGVGADQRVDMSLEVGSAAQTVSVAASTQLVDTQSSSTGALIDNKKVVEMPLSNRQFYALALLSPAAYQPAQNSTLGFRGGFNVAGVSEINNQFTINGTYDVDMGTNQPSFRPSIEDIQEFKLLTGVYSAEYGRMAGGQLVIVTKSGSNTFHGSAYEFFRNQVTDAKPFFTQPGGTNPAFKQNTFGVTLGGPIVKNKTFFFAAYEGQRIRQQITALATVPTPAMLAGQFNIPTQMYNPATGQQLVRNANGAFDLTKLPLWASAGAQVGQQIAALGFPAPTVQTAAGALPGNNYNFSETRDESMNEGSIRIDQTFSPSDSLFGSFNEFTDPSFEPSNTLCSSYVLPKFGCFTNQISTLIDVTYTHIFSQSLLNAFSLGFDRLQQPRVSQDATAIGSSFPGLPGAFTETGVANNEGLPNTAVNGFSTIGGATNLPQNRWDNHYEIGDALTWTHGAHTLKGGADLLFVNTTDFEVLRGRGQLVFNSSLLTTDNGGTTFGTTNYALADLLLGLPATTSNTPTAPVAHNAYRGYDFFAQDDWRVTQFLTLNLGLRYEVDGPAYDSSNVMSNFDLTTGAFVVAGPTTYKYPYNRDWNNFAPRIGFAWQPLKKDTTVIKGGFGIFYNAPLLYNQFLQLSNQAPIRVPATFTPGSYAAGQSVSLSNPFPSSLLNECLSQSQTHCTASLSPYGVVPNYATPHLIERSFGVQQALPNHLVLDVTYFGSHGTRLPVATQVNSIAPNTLSTAAAQALRPYSNFLNATIYETTGYSNYNSLQVSLTKGFSNGVSFLAAYTFGKSLDETDSVGTSSNSSTGVQNPSDPHADYGPSDFDVRQRFVFSPVAELPFGNGKRFLNSGWASKVAGGWQVSSIVTAQSGRPVTVTDVSTNNSGSFTAYDRPNLVPGQNPNAGPKTVHEWFNTAAFTLAPKGSYGNAGRNIITGPDYVDWDATLARTFPILERLQGEFRAEAFNLLNHPQFFNPLTQGAQYGSGPAFGTITQANDPRQMQFALRLLF